LKWNGEKDEYLGGVRNSAVASQPCPLGHITADKRLRCYAPSPKLPSATSFIRKTLSAIAGKEKLKWKW